jgi:F0F1-type ATP synthase membrane subunit c/vacuolar-type H+-ATPase subunit K
MIKKNFLLGALLIASQANALDASDISTTSSNQAENKSLLFLKSPSNAGLGLGKALAGTLEAIARQPELAANLTNAFKGTAANIIIGASTFLERVDDCSHGIGVAGKAYAEAIARQPELENTLKNVYNLGLKYFSTLCKTKFVLQE